MLDYEKAYEKELFSKMTRKEKLEHIFTYYKFPLILGACALFVIGWCLWHFVIHPTPATGLEVCFFSKYNNPDAAAELEVDLNEVLADSLGKKAAQVLYLTDFIDDPENADQEEAIAYKIMGEVAAQNLDIMVVQEDRVAYFATQSYFMPLTDLFTEEELAKITEALAQKAGIAPEAFTNCYLSSYIDEEKPEAIFPVAINCEYLPAFSRVIPLKGDCFLAVISNTERAEIAKEAILHYIFADGTD